VLSRLINALAFNVSFNNDTVRAVLYAYLTSVRAHTDVDEHDHITRRQQSRAAHCRQHELVRRVVDHALTAGQVRSAVSMFRTLC
jgi:hypothetical protein